MIKRNSYHSTIKLAFALDIHKQWLPKEFRQSIPKSTHHAWKKIASDKFVGYQFASDIHDNVDDLKVIYDKIACRERKLFISFVKLKITLVNILGKKTIKKAMKDNFRDFVRIFESSKNSFDKGVKTICSLMDINFQTYRYWKRTAKYVCSSSYSSICLKQQPSQATKKEIHLMRNLLTRKRFAHWPISSVWAYALRKEHVALSLSSWYRYNKKFKFRKRYKKGKFRKKYDPLVAPYPNHTWHADITIVKTLDGVKHYVYLIVDNFSRKIINWKVSLECNGAIRTQTLREAIKQEFGNDLSPTKSIDLIVDGGTENNNRTVRQFINESEIDIQKKVALKDIKQSNAMVEASNKTLKYAYLFKQPIYNTAHLIEHIHYGFMDYCQHRPHYALGILTPNEAHSQIHPVLNPEFKNNAVKERIRNNQLTACKQKCS